MFTGSLCYATGAGSNPVSLALGDVDHDRWLDVIAANEGPDQIAILKNMGGAPGAWSGLDSATTYGVGVSPYFLIAPDVNGDGFCDVVTTNYGVTYVSLFINDRQGGLGAPATVTVDSRADHAAAAYLNDDARLDLAVPCWRATEVVVLLNNTLPPVSHDWNGDDIPDECNFLPYPPSGVTDARANHPPTDVVPCRGIGEPGDEITICLYPAQAGMCGEFVLCETCSDPNCGPNSIEDCSDVGAGCYELTLAHGIAATVESGVGKACITTIQYLPTGAYVAYWKHPANVDGSSRANLQDISQLINRINIVFEGGTVPLWEADINNSGAINLADLTELINLLNGTGAYDPWFNTSKPVLTGCPDPCGGGGLLAGEGTSGPGGDGGGQPGGEAEGNGSDGEGGGSAESDGNGNGGAEGEDGDGGTNGAPADESGAGEFVMWFADFLSTTSFPGPFTLAEFTAAVEDLTGFCAAHLSPADRAELLCLLQDPQRMYASEQVEALIPNVLAALEE